MMSRRTLAALPLLALARPALARLEWNEILQAALAPLRAAIAPEEPLLLRS